MKRKNWKRCLAFLLTVCVVVGGLSLSPFALEGYFMGNLVFENEGNSNYRIPTIVTNQDGAVFAFCNDRLNSVADNAEIHWISYSVAKDGLHYSKPKYLLALEGWKYVIGSAVYDAVNDNILLIYYSSIVTEAAKNAYDALPEEEQKKNPVGTNIIESADGGETWTIRPVTLPNICTYPFKVLGVHGAGVGIQIKHGEYAGRLVFAAKTTAGGGTTVAENSQLYAAALIYSDDYGYTWRSSLNSMPRGSDESAVCELPDGTLYVSSRIVSNTNARYTAYSKDGGKTLGDKITDDSFEVACRGGVKGSVICIEDYNAKGDSLTLFSSLNSPSEFRRNLCIWISYDDGKTWPDMVTIDPGQASYSEMTYNKVTGLIAIMYERGDTSCYSSGIQIDTFDIDWLLNNKYERKPLRDTAEIDPDLKADLVEDSLLIHLDSAEIGSAFNGTWLNSVTPGTGNAVTNTGYQAPTVAKNALNGYSVLQFSSGVSMSIPALDSLTGNITYFIVVKSNQSAGDDSILFRSSHSDGMRTTVRKISGAYATNFNSQFKNSSSYNVWVDSENFIDTGWHILAVTWDGSEESAMLTQFCDGNNTLKFEYGQYAKRAVEKSGKLEIGTGFDGQIAELLVYNRSLNDDEVAKTGLALAEKFGLVWNLTDPVKEPVKDSGSGAANTQKPADTAADTQEPTDEGNEAPDVKPSSKLGLIIGLSAVAAAVAVGAVWFVIRKRKA